METSIKTNIKPKNDAKTLPNGDISISYKTTTSAAGFYGGFLLIFVVTVIVGIAADSFAGTITTLMIGLFILLLVVFNAKSWVLITDEGVSVDNGRMTVAFKDIERLGVTQHTGGQNTIPTFTVEAIVFGRTVNLVATKDSGTAYSIYEAMNRKSGKQFGSYGR